MLKTKAKRIFVLVAVIVAFTLTSSSQTPESQVTPIPSPTPPTCTGSGCESLSKANLFLKTFAPKGKLQGLTISQIEGEERVRLAFAAIDFMRKEIAAGKYTETRGKEIIDGYKDMIRDYIDARANEALPRASQGLVSDMPLIAKALGKLLNVARQDMFKGHEESAQHAMEQVSKVFRTFSTAFKNTCKEQSYPIEVALGLARQNELLGTSIDVTPCAKRKYSAELSNQGVNYHFETCSDLSILIWKLTISGKVEGNGEADNGGWEADVTYQGYKNHPTGEIEVFEEEIEEKEETVKILDDVGPDAEPNGWTQAPVPKPFHPPRKLLPKFRMTTIVLKGEHGFWGWTSNNAPWGDNPKWAEAEIKYDDKPCDPVTQRN